jgi:hypothetical protein
MNATMLLGEQNRMVKQIDLEFSIAFRQQAFMDEFPPFLGKMKVLVKQSYGMNRLL